jgi:hypothetical protein
MTMQISSTIVRTALVDYRAEVMRLAYKYPKLYKDSHAVIKAIDDVLLSIEGNITSVNITPATCNPNR